METGHRRRRLRGALSFRAVNRKDAPGYDSGLQRHHLLPLQLLARNCFSRLFARLGRARTGFDDFRRNGLLLPASDRTAMIMGLPLHRGPHRNYNAMVIERVGQIEARWSSEENSHPDEAGLEALYRLDLLQRALKRRLLDPRGAPLALNRQDPSLIQSGFAELDAMAESLWAASEPAAPRVVLLSPTARAILSRGRCAEPIDDRKLPPESRRAAALERMAR